MRKEQTMRFISNRCDITAITATGALGLALLSLAGCSAGETPTGTVTSGGSAALQGPLVFVHNATDKTTSVIGLRGDTGNLVIHTMGQGVPETNHPNGAYDGNAPGDMQFSEGEWIFVHTGAGNGVTLIDPLSGAKPIFEDHLQIGRRPVHIYRDPTDGEVIWSMIDGDATTGLDDITATIKDTGAVVDCSGTGGGAVTVLHNSHIGPGGNVPEIIGKVCLYAKGHKVTAFSQPTVTSPALPKYAFVSSTTAGEVAVVDNAEVLAGGAANPNYLSLVARVDLCTDAGEAAQVPVQPACDDESATGLTTPFTTNKSNPHGIRFSKLTGKVYSIQESYRTLVEIDPALVVTGPGHNKVAITRTLNLAGTPYTAFGITPDGRFLFLRGVDTAANPNSILGKIAVVDLASNSLTPIPFPDLQNIVPSTFKFAPDGRRLYMLASNTATGTGGQLGTQLKNILLEFDSSKLPASLPLVRTISLEVTAGNHNFDIYADGATGAGSARYVVVSNGTGSNSVSIVNATNVNVPQQNVPVGNGAGTIMVYYPDAALNGNQATSSLTGGSQVRPSVLSERLDDHGMPE
jgi:hypothetical protein